MNSQEEKLRIIPLGGVDEIGKNITAYEYRDDIVVVDCGLCFPSDDMLGVDLVIPDVTYLAKNVDRIRGIVITHGHEDHIGSIPYVLRQVPVPVYGTELSIALIEHKLEEHQITGAQLNVVSPGDEITLGEFRVRFIRVTHSISGAVALALTCPVGTVLHTGDFKIDFTPVDGEETDLRAIAELGSRGLLAMLADSTNVERPGFTMTERKVAETFDSLFHRTSGRIIIASFASNISRIKMIADAAERFGRKVCVVGRSMVNVVTLATRLGMLNLSEDSLIDVDDLDRYRDDEIVIITTGSQGETMSGLMRMAYGEHRKIRIRSTDLVILSSSVIPGNEKAVSRVINQLYRCGAEVIYEALAEVHVSGHACQEELKIMHSLAKPRYFIPVHGEYRHLWQHAKLAESMGMPADRIVIPEQGQVIELDGEKITVTGSVQAGSILVDGLGIGDVGNVVLRDRKHLSQDGLIIVVMAIDREQEMLVSGPDIISRGFVYVRESEELMENVRDQVRNILADYDRIEASDWNPIKNRVREELHKYINEQIKRNPMILPIMVEI